MSDILIVAATENECAFLVKDKKKLKEGELYAIENTGNHIIDLIVTGPGIVNTTYHLTRVLSKKSYRLAINIGICGSLNPKIKPVKILNINKDQFGDFGAENKNEFLDVFDIKLIRPDSFPFKRSKLTASFNKKLNCLSAISDIEGITVQKATGSKRTVKIMEEKYGPVVESMEGAAFTYVCLHENVPCLQIRAVSNMVEERNKNKWKVEEAVHALSGFVGLLLLEMETVELS